MKAAQDDKYAGFPHGIRDTREAAKERKEERESEKEDREHLKFVRREPCLIFMQHVCKGQVQPHHFPHRGTRTLWHDRLTVPLCMRAHVLIHNIGETRFQRRFGVDLKAEIARIWAARGIK